MRLLYHVPCGVVGGAETQLQYLINHLKAKHSILLTYESPELEPWLKTLGVPHKRMYSPNTLAKAAVEFNADVVQFYHSKLAYSAVKKIPRRPKVVEVIHNKHPFYFDSTTYPKDMTDICVCVSPDAQANLLSSVPRAKTLVIPNGIDKKRFHSGYGKPINKPLIGGYTGRLEGGDGKGIETLIFLMSQRPVIFEFVGQDLAKWKDVIEQHENLRYYPHTAEPELFYAKWDFFVSRSPNEGFGISIAEALACGLPSVIYDCGGICSYLEHGKHAFIAQDDEQMLKYINLVTSGDHSLKPDELDFGSEAMAARYEQLYEKLLLKTPAEVRVPMGLRQNKIKTLGVVPSSWSGVKKSVSQLAELVVDPAAAKSQIQALNPKEVIFGGWDPNWRPIAKAARDQKATVEVTIHHTPALHEFGAANRVALVDAIKAQKEGLITVLATPHRGLAWTLSNLGVECKLYENKLEDPGVRKKLMGTHLGIFGTGLPWKNVENQVLAAGLFNKDIPCTIHVQNIKDSTLIQVLGIKVKTHAHMDPKLFQELAGSMTINMAVNFTETFGYFPIESFLMGTPCLVSPQTPAFKNPPAALRACVCQTIDDPAEIEGALRNTLKNYEEISRVGREFCSQFIRREDDTSDEDERRSDTGLVYPSGYRAPAQF